MLDISVVLCTHNPRPDYLRRVLEALRFQILPKDQWELLLVDNASTTRLSTTWDLTWHPNSCHIYESRLGLSYARQRGIGEASANVLVFVDDDNILDRDYLAKALKAANEWPELGVWGSGLTKPEFEITPPEYLKDLVPYVALRTSDARYWSNIPTCKWAAPWGAGMCVRKAVADEYSKMWNQSQIQISGRKGTVLLASEDLEIDYVACSMGLGMAIFPELSLTHLIPKERISESYLLRLYEGTIASEAVLAYKWQKIPPRNPATLFGVFDLLANVLVRKGTQRRMYLAQKRAVRRALNIIRTSKTNVA